MHASGKPLKADLIISSPGKAPRSWTIDIRPHPFSTGRPPPPNQARQSFHTFIKVHRSRGRARRERWRRAQLPGYLQNPGTTFSRWRGFSSCSLWKLWRRVVGNAPADLYNLRNHKEGIAPLLCSLCRRWQRMARNFLCAGACNESWSPFVGWVLTTSLQVYQRYYVTPTRNRGEELLREFWWFLQIM